MAESAIEQTLRGAPRAKPARLRPFARMLAFARPYVGLILLVAACTLLFSAGRYARAYLMKPLLDGVLVPAVAPARTEPSSAMGVAPPEWLTIAVAAAVPDERLAAPSAPAGAAAEATATGDSIRDVLAQILLAALVIVVVTPLALFGRAYLSEYALGRIHLDVQRRLAQKLLALPLSRHVGRRTGDWLTRLQSDAQAVRETQKLVLQEFLISISMVTIGVLTLFYISVPLTLIALLAAPPIAFVLLTFGRRIRQRAGRRQARLGDVTQRLVGILSGIKVIRTFGGERAETEAFARETRALFRADMRVARDRVLSRATVEALNSAAGFVMLAVGAILVLQGRFGLTAGDVAAFATVLATTYKPVKNLSKGWGRLMEHVASGERLLEFLDADEERAPAGAEPIDRIEDAVTFEGVALDHVDESGRPARVLDGIDLTLRRGEVVAVVGRTGAGKTSLVDLLLGLYAPTRGAIRVDGRPLGGIEPASLRARMAVVGQEAFLFDATIEENVRYGRPDASADEVLAAARAAHVDEFASRLAEGMATRVGELGVRLSGGQRQRIAIARALLRRPDVLVLDEATSALDPETERAVREAIEAMRGDRLVVIVSHRLASVRDADRIVVLEAGRIVEAGTHPELMARDGAYHALASA